MRRQRHNEAQAQEQSRHKAQGQAQWQCTALHCAVVTDSTVQYSAVQCSESKGRAVQEACNALMQGRAGPSALAWASICFCSGRR